MTVQFRDDDTQQTAQSYALGYDALYAVVTCDPTSRVGWLGLGVSLRCNCTFEPEQQVFALLLSRNPRDLDALIYRAETLLQSGHRAAHRLQPMIDDLNAQLSLAGLRA